jgi:uncharacterized protein
MKLTKKEKIFVYRQLQFFYPNPNVQSMKNYCQHGKVSTFRHCRNVAFCSFWLNRSFHAGADPESLVRGAFLHDYYLYDWHEKDKSHRLHGYHHPMTALKNAQREFDLNETECDIIENHMWPLTLFHYPKSKEAVLVCIADKICTVQEVINSSQK